MVIVETIDHCAELKNNKICLGSMSEWFRALDLKSEGTWFKSSMLLLSGFVLGSREFNSLTALYK